MIKNRFNIFFTVTLSTLIVIMVIGTNCSSQKEVSQPLTRLNEKLFMDADTLEKAGFNHLSSDAFNILVLGSRYYILNTQDNMIVKFNGKNPERLYNKSGQGPAELLNPFSIFDAGNNTIGIFDLDKIEIVFFDLDLNFIKEVRVNRSIRKILKSNGKWYAFGDFDDKIFAVMDENLNIIDRFGQRDRKSPFQKLYPAALYMGYLLPGGEVADTSWLYVHSTCTIDILDITTKKKLHTLQWDNPYPPNQNTINNGTMMYSSRYVGKHNDLYVVQNSFVKKIKDKEVYYLMVFDKTQKLLTTFTMENAVISSQDNTDPSKIYTLDDNGNMLYMDLKEMK